jgi:transposase
MRPERRGKSGMDGGLTAASLISPLHHLRTADFLSSRLGPPQNAVLKKSRWLLLKREENLKSEQRFRLRDLLCYNLKTIRAYLLIKEAFQQLWDYILPRLGRQAPR